MSTLLDISIDMSWNLYYAFINLIIFLRYCQHKIKQLQSNPIQA